MQRLYLKHHVYVCQAPGLTILLDLRNDRYLAVDEQSSEKLSAIVTGWPSISHAPHSSEAIDPTQADAVVAELEANGVLTRLPAEGKDATSVAVQAATESVMDDDLWKRPSISARSILRFALAVCRAAVLLRMVPLEKIIARIRARKMEMRNTDIAEIKRLVASFEVLQPFVFTSRDACLFHALALVEFLHLHGVCADWVFGVRPVPFSAHCWVQCGQFALNDHPDNIRRFRPIMVV